MIYLKENNRVTGWLTSILHRMGVGHLLLNKVKEIKKEKGFDSIELQVNAKNRAAIEMYGNYGFTEQSVNMELAEDFKGALRKR